MVFVVLRERSEATARDIYDYCVGNMARFMVPRYIEIVDELPHNHVGKIEKEKLLAARSDRVWDAEIEVVRRGPGA
jgi:acyl-CoA synthetase (AMP-forming)/AMP-acid ligase II